jgi:hypothetical protein
MLPELLTRISHKSIEMNEEKTDEGEMLTTDIIQH